MAPTYTIRYPGHDYLDGHGNHETPEAAADCIRRALSWDDVVLCDPYDVPTEPSDDSLTTAWSAYETQAECDADQDGAYAPRIVEVS
jgi:hypothetical protein